MRGVRAGGLVGLQLRLNPEKNRHRRRNTHRPITTSRQPRSNSKSLSKSTVGAAAQLAEHLLPAHLHEDQRVGFVAVQQFAQHLKQQHVRLVGAHDGVTSPSVFCDRRHS